MSEATAMAWCAVAMALAGCGGSADLGEQFSGETMTHAMRVVDPFAPAPVNPDVGALYFTIVNSSDRRDRLTAVRVAVADSARIHDQVEVAGLATMQEVPALDIPPNATVPLVPGRLHVMLGGLQRAYGVGDSLQVEIVFEQAGTLTFWTPVISYADVAARREQP